MKRKELELDSYFIEYAMDSCFHEVKGKERSYVYSSHRPERLEKAGYLVRTNQHPRSRPHDLEGSIWYWPTAEGLKWWIAERAKTALGKYVSCDLPYEEVDAKTLAPYLEGKGIGGEITVYVSHDQAIWMAMRDGLLDFVSHRDYSGAPHNCEEYVTARLTKKGMAFYDAIPRLVFECA